MFAFRALNVTLGNWLGTHPLPSALIRGMFASSRRRMMSISLRTMRASQVLDCQRHFQLVCFSFEADADNSSTCNPKDWNADCLCQMT
jgi:hypothetical protein